MRKAGVSLSPPSSLALGVVFLAAALAGCGNGKSEAGVCLDKDGALQRSSFVFVESPASGERVASGFRVSGCSNTFEANVAWRLRARDGRKLASGFTQGGSRETGPFSFAVRYAIDAREVGQLEVYEPSVTSEGFPTVKNVMPVVLEP
jgi:immunoglobulin-like protein involved in spore germination